MSDKEILHLIQSIQRAVPAATKGMIDVSVEAANEIVELLKEQEPIAPSICGTPGGYSSWWYLCGKCKKPIDHKDRFCKRCGQAVKWDA